ncbi:hypothetical protein HU200_065453 [Digitaria exilis]|uniref:Glycosyl transferase 48 domain-containing protein n=1 Tax=Digitaria exilis TaxID=1010633 RepID=A0A834ZXC4_9POAL|nr:hypothetical protein HU200_065930 [Digitaria exilis]KAF8647216.1 hypothetical protein HU200_065453 [Digitaria exilis]
MVVIIVYVFLYGRLYLLGLLMALPMFMEIGLERGFRSAMEDFIIMQLQLCSVFFTFSLGTKSHYFGRRILHGGAKYRATGRGFVVRHVRFAENYRCTPEAILSSSMWFLVITWLFAPFLFNPSGFEWQKIVWDDWSKWISSRDGIGVP